MGSVKEESKGGKVEWNIETGIGSGPSPRWHIPNNMFTINTVLKDPGFLLYQTQAEYYRNLLFLSYHLQFLG